MLASDVAACFTPRKKGIGEIKVAEEIGQKSGNPIGGRESVPSKSRKRWDE